MIDHPTPTPVRLYGHAGCPMVPPMRVLLDQAKVPYEYVDIRQDAEARERVRAINNGNESVPTLEFPDGSTLTEPGVGTLRAKLASMGYRLPAYAWLVANVHWILIGAGLLWAILAAAGVI